MGGYGRVEEDLDEYEDDFVDDGQDGGQDEYYEDEDDEDGYEDDDQEEEPISEDAKKYLDLRQKLKEQLRKKDGFSSRGHLRDSTLETFGSFFGPSKPVIAERVIQESKSLLETRHLQAKASTSQSDVRGPSASMGKKVTSSSTPRLKNGVSSKPFSRQVKSKAQMLKDTRDYSFLLSEDAEMPKPSNVPAPKNAVPKTDSRSAQVPAKSNHSSGHHARNGLSVVEQRKLAHVNSRSRPPQPSAPQKLTSGSRASNVPSDSRRQLDMRKQPQLSKQQGTSNGSGPASRPTVPKVLPPRKPLSSSERRMPVSSTERRLPGGSLVNNRAFATAKTSTSNGMNGQRVPMTKAQSSGASNNLQHRRDVQRSSESRLSTGNGSKSTFNGSNSKYQAQRMSKQVPPRGNLERDRYIKRERSNGQSSVPRSITTNRDSNSKKRRAEDAFSDEDGFDFRAEIRQMFGRPKTYVDYDDDDDCDMMESGFDSILAEEARSARIAKREDDEEYEKIREEERREKLKRQAKLRKKIHR